MDITRFKVTWVPTPAGRISFDRIFHVRNVAGFQQWCRDTHMSNIWRNRRGWNCCLLEEEEEIRNFHHFHNFHNFRKFSHFFLQFRIFSIRRFLGSQNVQQVQNDTQMPLQECGSHLIQFISIEFISIRIFNIRQFLSSRNDMQMALQDCVSHLIQWIPNQFN